MAGTLTKDQILDGIAEFSVIQLSELLKDFEERFGVTAAAPVAVAAAAAPAGGGDAGWRRGGEGRVRRRPDRVPATRRSR
jgi:ribosomal protein L7/L12